MKKNFLFIYFPAGLISLFFSFWFAARESVINPDAICYLQSAESMRFGLTVAMHLCDQATWPFYSALIYVAASLTHLSYQTAAYSLDGLFSLISVLTFIAIVSSLRETLSAYTPSDASLRGVLFATKQSQGSNLILALAAIVILFAHEFNAVRQYIIRDHGYWAFYLLSIYFLLQYFRESQFRYAILWSTSLFVATLFRVEGAIFLALIPCVALFFKKPLLDRAKDFLKLNTLTLSAGAIFVMAMLFNFHVNLTRLHEVTFQLLHGGGTIQSHFTDMKNTLAKNFLTSDSVNEAGLVLVLMLISWYLLSVVANLSMIFTLLVIYAWIKKSIKFHPVLCAYVIVNVVITFAFLSEHLFLSKRYLIGLSLILMLWVPFALNDLMNRFQEKKWPLAFATLFIFISALGGIVDFGYSKQYIHDAGNWLAVNVPQQSTLYSNDFQTLYYSHHFGENLFSSARDYLKPNAIDHWKNYEFLAIRTDRKQLTEMNNITYPLVKVFQNKRGDQVRIYQRGQS